MPFHSNVPPVPFARAKDYTVYDYIYISLSLSPSLSLPLPRDICIMFCLLTYNLSLLMQCDLGGDIRRHSPQISYFCGCLRHIDDMSCTSGKANVGATQIMPHTFDVEGFFVSCFRKGRPCQNSRKQFEADGLRSSSQSLIEHFQLTAVSEEQSQEIQHLVSRTLGFEIDFSGRTLAESHGEIWMLPKLPPELAVLATAAKQPGVRVAVRLEDVLNLDDDLLLIAGEQAEKAKGMSNQDWAALNSGKEAGGKWSPSRSQRMARNRAMIQAATR